MAKRTVMIQVCDLHRREVVARHRLELRLGEQSYRLDLCADHLAEVRRVLGPWLKAAGHGRDRPERPLASTPTATRAHSAAVRAWARTNCYEVPARVRIPQAIHEAYAAAH